MPNHVRHIDRILRQQLDRFIADIRKDEWQGKERDCVNRFAMGYLVPTCGRRHFLRHPTQIGIEMSVAKPGDCGKRPTAPKDLVIWREPWSTCWDHDETPVLAPLAVIEWKVSRGKKGGRDTAHDTRWLGAFAKANARSVGYSVTLRFGKADEHCLIRVARFFRGEHEPRWFSA